MNNKKVGKIDISELNTPPEKHEYDTAKYFANRGFDIKFIAPHYIMGVKNADFLMCGKAWEMKSPTGSSMRTYEDNLRKAIKQSENIIFDLRRLNIVDEKKCVKILKKRLALPGIKELLVITKDGRLLTYKGNFGIIRS